MNLLVANEALCGGDFSLSCFSLRLLATPKDSQQG